MKLFIAIVSVMLVVSTSSVQAAPFAANDKNPQVVAYYETGPHGIVGENEYHEGIDLVMRDGSNGGFQQWFYGTSESEGLHGEHSVWKVLKAGEECEKGWDLVVSAHPEWGYYLTPDVDYCVHTNDFKPDKK